MVSDLNKNFGATTDLAKGTHRWICIPLFTPFRNFDESMLHHELVEHFSPPPPPLRSALVSHTSGTSFSHFAHEQVSCYVRYKKRRKRLLFSYVLLLIIKTTISLILLALKNSNFLLIHLPSSHLQYLVVYLECP